MIFRRGQKEQKLTPTKEWVLLATRISNSRDSNKNGKFPHHYTAEKLHDELSDDDWIIVGGISKYNTYEKDEHNITSEEAVSSATHVGNESSHAKRIDYSRNFEEDLDNFLPGYRLVNGVLEEELVLVQFHSNIALGQGHTAKWWTTNDQANQFATVDDVHQALALLPDWGERTTVSVARIPKGTKVTFYVGQAREQVSIIGQVFEGGGIQYRFKDFDPSWIVETQEMRGLSDGCNTGRVHPFVRRGLGSGQPSHV